MVDWGCVISTNPLVVKNVPTPDPILTVTPVPDVSLMFQASRIISFPPISTVDGVAVKESTCGAGQLATVIVTKLSTLQEPFALTAVSR